MPSEPAADDWDEIHGFASPGEFHRFEKWLRDAIEEGVLIETPVDQPYIGREMLEEHWYRSQGQAARLASRWTLIGSSHDE